ncbi:MAG TPA: acetyl-CoA acetyltransferase [Candidatus Binataceae bacterium]|jgi:acetyl-CoA C-acetyltransferase|nr:acetyl-CoA acetyltransferase [Candidatus Binataceae bacterium]
MAQGPVYILGGAQSDFARNWNKEGKHFVEVLRETTTEALTATGLEPRDIGTAHFGNFAAELYAKQGQLGAFFLELDPAFAGLPTSRHEAACASGSIAILAASADLEAGRYDCAAVIGLEQMKTVDTATGGDFLGTAGWYERECKGKDYPFPRLFGRLGDEYDKRFGLKDEHLAHISSINYSNARRNPLAQTRGWPRAESDPNQKSKFQQVLAGRIRVGDCSQVTDGCTVLFLAAEKFAADYARRRGIKLDDLPRILGWGHHTARMEFDAKVAESKDNPYVLPHTRQAILDAFRRAGVASVFDVDGIETHDCFTTSEYMAIDHFGLTGPGESWKAIEEGVIEMGGKLPINPSGGLIGAGHPVGATGVRQMLDCYRQVTQRAGEYQVEGAKRFAMLNIGGSGTTSCAFVVGR